MRKTAAKNVTKTDVRTVNSYGESLLAKQVEAGRSKRGVNPERSQNPAHAAGHRRLNLRQPVRH